MSTEEKAKKRPRSARKLRALIALLAAGALMFAALRQPFNRMLGTIGVVAESAGQLPRDAQRAADLCVQEALADSVMPASVGETGQMLGVLRDALKECVTPSEGAIKLNVSKSKYIIDQYRDEQNCRVFVRRSDWHSRDIAAAITGASAVDYRVEMKAPGDKNWTEPSVGSHVMEDSEKPEVAGYRAGWLAIPPWPEGLYEVRYRQNAEAEPVTIAFDMEFNGWYTVYINCPD